DPLALLRPPLGVRRRALHSLPTRRSSDLCIAARRTDLPPLRPTRKLSGNRATSLARLVSMNGILPSIEPAIIIRSARSRRLSGRSEEHTSELQSRFDLVCRLLLETQKATT